MARTVICGVDHSPTARSVVEAAAAVAAGRDARVLLAHSRDGGSVPSIRAMPHPGFPGWVAADPGAELAGEELVADLANHTGDVPTDVVVFDGDPARGLCRLAELCDDPLLVVGARGRGLFGSLVAGSVSAAVVRRAPCPVMVVPDTALEDVERPLVDGATVVCGIASHEDRCIGRVAASLAVALDVRLRLAHVLTPLSATTVPAMAGVLPPTVMAAPGPDSRAATAMLRELVEDLTEEFPELRGATDWSVRSGRPGEELAQLAASCHAAAVVVGTCGHGLLGAAAKPSPAWTLARAATVPVVVCRDTVAALA